MRIRFYVLAGEDAAGDDTYFVTNDVPDTSAQADEMLAEAVGRYDVMVVQMDIDRATIPGTDRTMPVVLHADASVLWSEEK